jgi:hypothetical protein
MPPSPLVTPRAAAALVLGAAASALGGLILGEYDFSGATPYAAGLLFGLVVAELVLEVGKLRSWLVGLVAAACVAAGLGWAAWISSGEGLRPFPRPAWAAMAIGALTCGWRAGRRVTPSMSGDGTDAVDASGQSA